MPITPLLAIDGLTASVDEKSILHDIHLGIPAGETHVLMGPNAPASRRSATSSWATRPTRKTPEPSPSTGRT